MALGVTLLAAASVAHAQTVETVITVPPAGKVIAEDSMVPPSGVLVAQPAATIATVPVETVETVRTVRTTPSKVVSRRVTRTRTIDRVATTRTTTVRRAVAAAPATVTEPTYTEVVQGPRYYDVVTPAPVAPPAIVEQPVLGAPPIAAGTALPAYRYVYQPDRILVVDPYTNIAVQAIPR
jgi:hypothetical protein